MARKKVSDEQKRAKRAAMQQSQERSRLSNHPGINRRELLDEGEDAVYLIARGENRAFFNIGCGARWLQPSLKLH